MTNPKDLTDLQEVIASGDFGDLEIPPDFIERYWEAKKFWDGVMTPLIEQVRESETLNQKDYSVRINARA